MCTYVVQMQDVSMKPEATSVNVRRVLEVIRTLKVAKEHPQSLNAEEMKIAPDNSPAKPQFVSTLALPSPVGQMPSVFLKTMPLGAAVKQATQKMPKEVAYPCVNLLFVEAMLNA